ncbi:hypothetical protein AGLY_005285 [Aphis glycines]|uniref:C2H2-type domain-containing protein n=1 Tax=Aphis glycines TaxID=307491 RepID=A0A6G0TYQ5_APHGL|nr:hypothetical protein AGLY_005285 [Aphis glycines]
MSTSGEQTSSKKGKGSNRHTTVTTTTSNGFISKAMIKFLHYQSLKVSNTKNLSNIQMIAQNKIILPKAETGHSTTTMNNTCNTAVADLQCQSLNSSNKNNSIDTLVSTKSQTMVSQIESKALLKKRTATIGNKFTVKNTVVNGNSLETTTIAMGDNNENIVHSIGGEVDLYLCKICNRSFKHPSNLNEHNKIHKLAENKMQPDVIRPYVCNICGLAFRKVSTLTVHHRIHTGEKPFVCNVCGDVFSCSANRSVHMRTHTGYRPYVCKFCGFAFNQSHVLTEHVRLHTGERPYECGLCKMAFVSSGLLRKHTIKKHNKHA